MRILSLVVPSSTCIGWAVLETGEVYVASGMILPGHVQAPSGRVTVMRGVVSTFGASGTKMEKEKEKENDTF